MDAFVVFASGCAWEEGGRALTLQEGARRTGDEI